MMTTVLPLPDPDACLRLILPQKFSPYQRVHHSFYFRKQTGFFMLNNFHLICFNYTINIDHYNRKNA